MFTIPGKLAVVSTDGLNELVSVFLRALAEREVAVVCILICLNESRLSEAKEDIQVAAASINAQTGMLKPYLSETNGPQAVLSAGQ